VDTRGGFEGVQELNRTRGINRFSLFRTSKSPRRFRNEGSPAFKEGL